MGNAWTPSSYAIVLQKFGISELGIIFGEPRAIRSDEYSVLTPYFQIAVRNLFERYNEFSPYKEDLRSSFFALPLRDWALPLKPHLWGFFVLPPAYAYSLYHYLLVAAFVGGYTLLLLQLGVRPRLGVLVSLILLFSHFTQVWWTMNAPTFAFAPWPVAVFLNRWKWFYRLPALAYVSAVWLFSLLYPPFIISAAFALCALAIAFRRECFRPAIVLPSGIAITFVIGLVWLYFGDAVQVMQHTVYPGQREAHGGELSLLMFAAHLFPHLAILDFEPLIPGLNVSEVSVVSSYFVLAFLVFVDHRELVRWALSHRWPVFVCIAGFAMMSMWMLLPLPAWMGKPLLWHLVPARRMLWGAGLLLTLGVAVISSKIPWRLTKSRFVIFASLVLVAYLLSKLVVGEAIFPALRLWVLYALVQNAWRDWFILVPLLVLALTVSSKRFPAWQGQDAPQHAVMAAVLVAAFVTFGGFNPIQSAKPIFAALHSPFLEALRDMAAVHPKRWAAIEGRYGANLNGVGIPAINHVLLAPRQDFFKPLFPDLSAHNFNFVFNRYAHIAVDLTHEPQVPDPDWIKLPLSRFGLELPVQNNPAKLRPEEMGHGGHIDHFSAINRGNGHWEISIRGWADFQGWETAQQLLIIPNMAAQHRPNLLRANAFRLPRSDVAIARADQALSLAGFILTVEIEVNPKIQEIHTNVVKVISSDPHRGLRLVPSP